MNSSGKIATINSNPSEARIFVDGNDTRKVTPSNVEFNKVNKNNYILVEKEGYESAEYVLSRNISPWIFGNLLLGYGFPIGVLFDFLSGSAYKLHPNEIIVDLKAE